MISPSRPAGCIRGPELHDPATIAAEIRTAEADALTAYAEGVTQLCTAHTLLQAQRRLEEARRTRDFLIAQLVWLEARDAVQFDAALAHHHASAQERSR